jgi:hypothetical protein
MSDNETNLHEPMAMADPSPGEPENLGALVGEPGTVLDRLKEIRREFQAEHEVALEIPGYRGELLARYVPLPWEVIRNLTMRAERMRRAPDIEVTVAADGLINACVGFVYRDVASGKREPLKFGGEEITGYGPTLARALGIENVETVREITKAVFPDDMALVSHYGMLMDWQAERNDSDEERVQSAATTDEAVHPTSS